MEDVLINLLKTFDVPVYRQGSLSEDEDFPETFFTFWNNDESEQSAYDNETASVVYDFDVNTYSSNPEVAYELLKQARDLLKENGFIIATRAKDVPSGKDSHVGRGMNIEFLKFEN